MEIFCELEKIHFCRAVGEVVRDDVILISENKKIIAIAGD